MIERPSMSLVIPVYKNSQNISPLLAALTDLYASLDHHLEVVFVVDGSPDDSHAKLAQLLPESPFPSQLLLLSRNFGSFSAVRAGLEAARGPLFAVMAADLQEPPELIAEFYEKLRGEEYDVAVGYRQSRSDPLASRISAGLFWGLYRRFVLPDIPPGGVDVFGCNRAVRDQILGLQENHSSLVGLLFWVGYRRVLVPYVRARRQIGKSGWTFTKKMNYMMDSIFSFSDLPIRALLRLGLMGILLSLVLATRAMVGKLTNAIPIQGYTTIIIVVSFFGGLNCVGLGIIGGYVWRTFENTKARPNYIVASRVAIEPEGDLA